MMLSTWASLLVCLTVVAAVEDTVRESDVQHVVSHLRSLMPLYETAPERFRRQVQSENETTENQPPLPPPPPSHMHFKVNKCCKKMPKIMNMKTVRECFKSIRPAQPPGGPGGPPPPPGGPPPPPPATDMPEDEESVDNGSTDVEAVEDADGQNAATSEQLRHIPGGKSCKGGRHPGAHRNIMACATQCAFEKESLIQDGTVDQEAFAAYVDKYVEEKNAFTWKDALDAALQNCSASVPASVNQQQNCTSGAMEMLHCMDRQIFVNCPESNWKSNDEKCEACRAAQENCGYKRGPHKRV
ncbi:hypothetical protein B7P43_G08485 [Cryptotermes secundus]|uniref:Uncharacterized protein n=1 Tax=Cryptotermes secundus TaxID=105785 RepID=A0A2J7PQF2_9NEOP|nr:uncharacterized protein LOC111872468 [Cryptotermes secundus]PNF18562.1 hypothetical protein B7P43_G08485 [Cryptotermes secundus]